MKRYYAVPSSMPGRFDLRQERFRAQFEAGREHKFDLMAVAFKPDELRGVVGRMFGGAECADLSALPAKEAS